MNRARDSILCHSLTQEEGKTNEQYSKSNWDTYMTIFAVIQEQGGKVL